MAASPQRRRREPQPPPQSSRAVAVEPRRLVRRVLTLPSLTALVPLLLLVVLPALPGPCIGGAINNGGVIKAPTRGPCSASPVAITVSSAADFNLRTAYRNTTTVVIYLASNITLNSSLILSSAFSCSIIRPHPSLAYMPWLWYPRIDKPAVRLVSITNVQIIGVAIGFPAQYRYTQMVECTGLPEFPSKWTCPSLHVYRAYAVTFSNGRVHGRTDVYRGGAVEFSYMRLFNDYLDEYVLHSWATIRMVLSGDPINLIRSLNKITNCDIRGSWTGVMLYGGTVGAIVANNFITDFQFSGLQCGMGESNVADCMLNTIQNNLITAESDVYPIPHGDGAGIYYDLHWYNPGNLDSCNYMIGGTHCYYLDYTTSGTVIDGAVCIRNHDGIKINTGHANKVRSALVITPEWQSGLLSCQNWCDNNCNSWAGRGMGFKWYNTFVAKFEMPGWKKNWPWLSNLCGRTEWAPGIQCNPTPQIEISKNWTGYCSQLLDYSPSGKQLTATASMTGNCSSIPGLNDIQMIVVNGTRNRWNPYYINCDNLPSVQPTNNLTSTTLNYPPGFFDFDDVAGEDFGVSDLSSRMYQLYPNFLSCPRSQVGIRKQGRAMMAAASSLQSSFSRDAADWWHDTYSVLPFSKEVSDVPMTGKLKARLRKRPIQPKRKAVGGRRAVRGRRALEYELSAEPPYEEPLGGTYFDQVWVV
ncbi:hypothetical protein CLOM_g14491 [Closterium sp. NIES-68]|nr:hypothetical protein CLOM_g14491 [Closterium sp. NIES-68]GJP84361.1 hypothetical protein CLOP_g14422 [Closterium sp. NIES-67]